MKIATKLLCLLRISQLKENPMANMRVKYVRYGNRIPPNKNMTVSIRKKVNKNSRNKYLFFACI